MKNPLIGSLKLTPSRRRAISVEKRLAGWQFVTGLIRFQVICAVGAISNVGIATVIYRYDPQWWIAGLGGALMGAVWNYVVSAAFVWRQR